MSKDYNKYRGYNTKELLEYFDMNQEKELNLKKIMPLQEIKAIENRELRKLVLNKHIEYYLDKNSYDNAIHLLKNVPYSLHKNRFCINRAVVAIEKNEVKGAFKLLDSIDELWAAYGYVKVSEKLNTKGDFNKALFAAKKAIVNSNGEIEDAIKAYEVNNKCLIHELIKKKDFKGAKYHIDNIDKFIRFDKRRFTNLKKELNIELNKCIKPQSKFKKIPSFVK